MMCLMGLILVVTYLLLSHARAIGRLTAPGEAYLLSVFMGWVLLAIVWAFGGRRD